MEVDLFHDVSHVAYVSGHNEVGGSDTPNAELSAVLRIALSRTVLHHTTIQTALQYSMMSPKYYYYLAANILHVYGMHVEENYIYVHMTCTYIQCT